MSTDSVLNARDFALISLLTQHELQLLSDKTQLFQHATSIGRSGPESGRPVVDYAIASHAAAPWVPGVIMGNAWLMLSNHCSLMLSLALPASPTTRVSALPTL